MAGLLGNDGEPITIDFAHQLWGFIAGEGCFRIDACNSTYFPRFALCLRGDDGETLKHLHSILGGRLHTKKGRGNIKPQLVWQIASKKDLRTLVLTIDMAMAKSFPFKKSKDFDIFRRSVALYIKKPVTVERSSAERRREAHRINSRLAAKRIELSAVKQYAYVP